MLFLRDSNAAMVEAWRLQFGPSTSVDISSGSILHRRADAIVSPANSFGFMDGGVDLAYSRFFGWGLQDRLRALLREDFGGELPVGAAVVVATGHADIPWLVSAPTMRVPEVVSGTVNAYLALRAALRAVDLHNLSGAPEISTLLCPGLGTGVGRMEHSTCARQMHAAWLGHREPLEFINLGMAREVDRHLKS